MVLGISDFVRNVGLGGGGSHFFGIAIFVTGHVFCQAEGLHAFGDGVLDYVFEIVLCVAGTKLSRMAMH
jgi:hypothetical protein